MKIYVSDKETGTFITEVESIDNGLKKIAEFEQIDKENDSYTPDFYDVVDENHSSLV
jgi:hypothetical protein